MCEINKEEFELPMKNLQFISNAFDEVESKKILAVLIF